MKTYQNPKRKNEFIEVRTKGNKKEFKQYILDSEDRKSRYYKGCDDWRTISENDLINITTTFEGDRWIECKQNKADNKYLKNYDKKEMREMINELINVVKNDKNKNKSLENDKGHTYKNINK